uniref:Uncharacterized protein n=1 Tax=viral metagenome TaxID=1070528 RepID=A0A6M3LEU4_9ZZZZ
MLIAQIKQLTQTDGWVDFTGRISEVGEIKTRTKSDLSKTPGQQYNVQKLKIQDNGDEIGVWAYALQQFLPGQSVVVKGMLKEYSNHRYIDYATVTLIGQQVQQQQPQQSPPQQSQRPRAQSQNNGEPDMIKVRSMAVAYTKDLVCSGHIEMHQMRQHSETFTGFILTGKWIEPVAPQNEQEEASWDPENLAV